MSTDPRQVVQSFLAACAAEDFGAIPEHLAPQLIYHNVGMPVIHGRDAAVRFLRMLFGRPGTHFEVRTHRMAVDGNVVLTERTDVSIIGPLRFQFWVCGVFEVEDGRITLWRDYFDFFDITKSVLRAVLGAVIPALRPRLPLEGARP